MRTIPEHSTGGRTVTSIGYLSDCLAGCPAILKAIKGTAETMDEPIVTTKPPRYGLSIPVCPLRGCDLDRDIFALDRSQVIDYWLTLLEVVDVVGRFGLS